MNNQDFTIMKIQFFKKDVNTANILISSRISSIEKNYRYFISYTDHFKIKPFSIVLPKTSVYEFQIKWMYFLIEDDDLLKNIIIFIMNSAAV